MRKKQLLGKVIRNVRVRTWISLGLIIILLPIIAFVLLSPKDTAAWFNDHYSYRQKFQFTHNATISDPRAITVTLDTAELITDGVMQSDCDDTRFTDLYGKELKYDLTGTCNNASTTYEVIFPTVLNGTQSAYVYYGNPSAYNSEIDSTIYTALTPSGGDPSAITTRTNEETGPSPVAYWSFDEGTGQNINDSISSHTGTLGASSSEASDDPSWATEDQCISGKCLQFDGSDDYGLVPSSGKLSALTQNFTVSLWMKGNTLDATYRRLIARGTNPSQEWYIENHGGDPGKLVFFGGGSGSNNTSATRLEENKWYQITMVNDGSDAILYINGIRDASTTFSGSVSASSNVAFGADADGGQGNWDGFIDEVKIYPYARTATEIKQDYIAGAASAGSSAVLGASDQSFLSDGLVGYWPMDERSGTTVADESGNSKNGTLTNAQETGTSDASSNTTTTVIDTDGTLSTTDDAYNGMILSIPAATCGALSSDEQKIITDYVGSTKTFTVGAAFSAAPDSCDYTILHQVGGKFGNALNFDGENDYVASTGISESSTERSFFAWMKRDAHSGVLEGIIEDPSNVAVYIVVASTGLIQTRVGNNGGTTATCYSSSSITDTNWHHIGLVVSEEDGLVKRRVFIDGQDDTGTCTELTGTIGSFDLGGEFGRYNGGSEFNGKLDEIRIYERPLSPAEVSALYNWAPGPVGHWKFEEAAGTSVADSGTGGKDMTLTSTEFTQGKFGHGLTFPTSSAHALIADTTDSPLDMTTAITTEAWVYLDDPSDVQTFIYRKGGANDYYFYITNTLRVGCYIRGIASVSSDGSYPINLDEWTHIACTYDGASVKTYINGVLRSTNTTSGLLYTSNSSVEVGNTSGVGNNYRLRGALDELKIYNYARSQEQIVEGMRESTSQVSGSLLPDPVAYWALDEGYGQTINDSQGDTSLAGTLGANSGSSTDDPTWTGSESCKTNGCLSFDGGDYIIVPDDSTLSPGSGNQTISAWFNTSTNHAATGWIYSNYGTTTNNVAGLAINSSEQMTCLYRDGSANTAQATTTDTWNDGAWHRASCVRDGTTARLYIDGVEVATNTNASLGTITTTTRDISIGSYAVTPTSQFFTGLVDEVSVYNIALSPEQIAQDYNAGSAVSFGATAATEKSTLGDGAGAEPIASWNFDEATGTTANDTSGNGNDGTLTNMTNHDWVTGKYGKALEFDGSNDYVDIPYSFSQDTSLTVSLWFKTTGNNRVLFGQANQQPPTTPTNHIPAILVNSSGQIRAEFWSGSTGAITTAESFNDGKWHHVALAGQSTAQLLYVDGRYYGYRTGTIDHSWWTYSTIGAGYYDSTRGNGSNAWSYFDGAIDQVKIWDYSLTQSQISYEYNRGAPIAHWQFDECQGSTVYDTSGNNLNGTIVPNAGTNTSAGTCNSGTGSEMWNNGSSGKYDGSLDFDGADDWIQVTTPTKLNLRRSLSVCAWYKTDQTNDGAGIFEKTTGGGVNTGYLLFTEGTNYFFRVKTASTTETIFSNTTLAEHQNEWTHICGTHDTFLGYISIYINGTLDKSTAITPIELNYGSGNAYIGHLASGVYPSNGQIDDLRVYNYALSPAQVKKLYNGGAAVSFR